MFNVLVKIDGCDPFKTEWAEFAADNADGIDGVELMFAEEALAAGHEWIFGGGAGPLVTVTPAI